MSILKILLAVVAAEVAALAAALGALYGSSYIGGAGYEVSAADLGGVLGLSCIAALLLCLLFYTPGLLFLRRRRHACRPVSTFLLASTILLNLPAFVLLTIGVATGKLSGLSEAAVFVCTFLAAGFAFGLVFVSLCRNSATQ